MKNCSQGLGCSYRLMTSAGSECSFTGNCAYQMPQEEIKYYTASTTDTSNSRIIELLEKILEELKARKNP